MARLKNNIDQKQLEQLLQITNNSFGKPLTHSFECEVLSNDIKRVTGLYVSPQTLRRLYGFLKADFAPSIKTLNILSLYAGFTSWHSFTQQAATLRYSPVTFDQEADFYLDFYKMNVKEEADMNYHNASRKVAIRILHNPALLATLSPALAANPVSQIFFFERFPFTDGLCNLEYKRSIQQYLQKKGAEPQIFGNSLLFLSAFLCKRQEDAKQYLDNICKYDLKDDMHPFIIARSIGSRILYESLTTHNYKPLIKEAQEWNKYFLPKERFAFWRFPHFQYMMSDYLNLAELFKESLQIVRTIKHLGKKYETENGYEEALEVIYKIASHSLNTTSYLEWMRTTSCFDNIHPLSKKFYQLQCLCIQRSIVNESNQKQRLSATIDQLVNETGFTFFSNPMP